jgi:peptidoglycan/xylan/chitin deacetylase (PgdA/CDA1 family)
MPLDEFTALGAAGVVFILDASHEALKGQYLPFEWKNEAVPALYVDRDAGAKLRAQSAARPRARLTLTATRKTVPSPTVTAVLPGRSKETLIFNTHTDGQGFVEENGPVGFVHLARYFAKRRPKRTIVFAAWPGHMSNDLPQAQGWIDAHKDLVDRAAAALTVEHLGCSEWADTADRGYHATGRAELFAVWTSQGKMFETVREATVRHDLPRTALMRPPAQFGVGGPFHQAGVPQIGAIAGPEYLLTISDHGELDKLDEKLAAKQIAWLADIARKVDAIDAAELRAGDPTLGSAAPTGNIEPSDAQPRRADCRPPVKKKRKRKRKHPRGRRKR